MRRSALTILTVALLVGSVGAFAYTERLKLERSPVGRAQVDAWLSPVCDCPREVASVSFELRKPERLDVTVVDGDGELVRRLEQGSQHAPGEVELAWDGRDEAGRIVPDGSYRVRVRLREARRTISIPESIHVDTTPPDVDFWRVSQTVLFRGETTEVAFRANEIGRAVLLVDGEDVWRGPLRRPGDRTVRWNGEAEDGPLPSGVHTLTLAVEDRAGNRSEPTRPVTIVVAQDPPQA